MPPLGGRGEGGAWLDGEAAAAMACDAAMAPIVTGEVNPAVLEDLIRLCVQLDKLRYPGPGRPGTGTGSPGGDPGGPDPDPGSDTGTEPPVPASAATPGPAAAPAPAPVPMCRARPLRTPPGRGRRWSRR